MPLACRIPCVNQTCSICDRCREDSVSPRVISRKIDPRYLLLFPQPFSVSSLDASAPSLLIYDTEKRLCPTLTVSSSRIFVLRRSFISFLRKSRPNATLLETCLFQLRRENGIDIEFRGHQRTIDKRVVNMPIKYLFSRVSASGRKLPTISI